MATFKASTRAEAIVLASQADIWAALVEPNLMAQFTPFLKRITADGEHWVWEMSGIEVAGRKIAPVFTERMVFSEPDRIEFHHDPPGDSREKAGVEGWYELTPEADGTRLVTELEISLVLPLPKAAGGPVRATMRKVIDTMGDRFSANLLAHLHAEERPVD